MDDSKSKALVNKFQFYFNHEPCERCKEIHRGKPYDSCVRMSTRWARNFFGRLLGLKFVRALNNYSKWRRFWTSPVQVTKNLESSRLACTGIPSTTGSPKITKRSPNVERNKIHFHNKGFALCLVLKVRFFGTRKWPISTQCTQIKLIDWLINERWLIEIPVLRPQGRI